MNELSETLVFTLAFRVVLLAAALINLNQSTDDYRHDRSAVTLHDVVSAWAMLGAALALFASSTVIREFWPEWLELFRVITGLGVTVFAIGLLFSAVTWRFR